MDRNRLLTAAVGAFALAVACTANGADDAGPPAGATEVPMERIVQESYSGIETRRREVITTQAEWEAFWAELTAGRVPRPATPAVAFDRETVIAAAMGQRPTGGHAIEIAEIRRTADELVAVVVETRPGAGCMATQAITAPVDVARVAAAGLPVRFVERERVRDCE